jgi:hypothetical protein
MQHNAILICIVLTAGYLGIVGCRSRPTPTTNYSCSLSDTQITNFTAMALAGDGDAAFKLSEYYEFIPYDQTNALKWMKVAAEDGNLSGQYNLAREYEGMFDTNMIDLIQSRYWYQRAANAGDADSKRRLDELKNQ